MAIRCIKGISILDVDGRRVCAKYFDPKLAKEEQQRQFEAKLFAKTKNMLSNSEVVMIDKKIVVLQTPADVFFYVIGDEDGNELIYAELLEGLSGAISGLLRGKVEKQSILENLELILLTLDELVDGGVILEMDPLKIANRVLMKNDNGEEPAQESTSNGFTWGKLRNAFT